MRSYIPFYKSNLKVAIPVMLSQIGQVIVQMADTMMVGQLGAEELAAVSFASAIFNTGLLFAMGTALGLTPLVGEAYARKESTTLKSLFKNAYALNIILFALVGLLLWITSFFMTNMGQTLRVAELAVPYFRVMVISMLPLMIFLVFKQFLEGMGNTKMAMNITIGTNVLNIILNWVFIYGNLGAPAMGVQGAATATLIARILMPIIFVAIFIKREELRSYLQLLKGRGYSVESILSIAKVGVPIGTQIFVEQIAFSLTAVMVGWLGAVALASHQVAMNISFFCFMILSGLGAGTTVRVSHQYGLGAFRPMRKAAFASFHLTIFTVMIAATIIVLFRHQIPTLFSSDADVIATSASLLLICALYQLPDGFQVVTLGALRGISDVKRPMIYAVISYLFINIPVGYYCGFVLNMGPVGIWIGFIFGLTTASLLFLYRFNAQSKRHIEKESIEVKA
ncbi:MAG: MATE family efflux transporter [Bacteroidales bacterium]